MSKVQCDNGNRECVSCILCASQGGVGSVSAVWRHLGQIVSRVFLKAFLHKIVRVQIPTSKYFS